MIDTDDAGTKFQKTMDLLNDPQASFTAEMIYSLSDLAGETLETFGTLWPTLSTERRRDLIRRLVSTAETNFEMDFSAIIRMALDDPNEQVRKAAIEGVLEDDSSHHVIKRLMTLAQDDLFADVRAAAAGALGQFVLLGELGKLSEALSVQIQDTVLALHNNPNEDIDVRRRALEAVSNCGREGVNELIREAYYADDPMMRVSAVFAMGRSCDSAWAPQVLEELGSDEPAMRYEAARAAGELELRRALPFLAELAFEDDREIQEVAIWALGEIGGSAARKVLADLAALADETGDDELAEAVAEAQSAANLAGEDLFPLFDFSDYDMLDDTDDFDLYEPDNDF